MRCTVSELLARMGLPQFAEEDRDGVHLAVRRVGAGEPVISEGARLDAIYVVMGGTFKSYQTDPDGYEHIEAFSMRGDALGLDAIQAGRHRVTVAAVEASLVAVLPLSWVLQPVHESRLVRMLLLAAASRELTHRSQALEIMAAVSADVRLARFLVHLSQRQGVQGYSSRRFRLRMTRRDIASFLGVAKETISRSLAVLQRNGLVAVHQRDIELLDERGLVAFQRYTRKPASMDLVPCKQGVQPAASIPKGFGHLLSEAA